MTDELIDEMLHKTHMDAFPDNVLKKRTKNMIMAKNEERKMQMRKLGIKKSIILATACCLLFGTVVIAAVPKKATVQHTTAGEFTSYSDIAIQKRKQALILNLLRVSAMDTSLNGLVFYIVKIWMRIRNPYGNMKEYR